MLFAFRLDQAEYRSLRALFREGLVELDGAPWRVSTSRSESMCFVLYAAEWWRREYAGGPWRWTSILGSLGWRYDLNPLERAAGVERGLRGWGHRPSGQGKKYLGAIVAHGGLPLQLIDRGDGAITRLLVRATRQAQLYGWDDQRLQSFFDAHALELVPHLRDDEIYRLLASVVTTVLTLRYEHHLAGVSDPIEVLDRARPNWRDLFPISVESDSARVLLVRLVREAAQERAAGSTAFPVVATRALQLLGGAAWHLACTVAVPSRVPLHALGVAVGLQGELLPQAFSVDLVAERRFPLAEGRQLLGAAERLVVLSGRTRNVEGLDGLRELRFALRSKGVDLAPPVAIPGGEPLDDQQPWIFVERDGAWILVGVGSCRVGEDRCRLVVPPGAAMLPAGAESSVSRCGELSIAGKSRDIYELSGAVEIRLEADTYTVRTHQTTGLAEQLVWRGARDSYRSSPHPVFRGVPALYRLDDDGQLQKLPAARIAWMTAARPSVPVSNPAVHVGPIDAWLVADGIRIRRFRMALLPVSAALRFWSGDDQRSGAVELHNWGCVQADVPAAVDARVEHSEHSTVVHLRVAARPPAVIPVQLTWPGSTVTATLVLPFPASGARFTNSSGEEFPSGSLVSVGRMAGVRVQVVDRNPNAPQHYRLVAELLSRGMQGARLPCLELPIDVDPDGSGELRLLDVEARLQGLLCQSDQLDARLSLQVFAGAKLLSRLDVVRYDCDLERDGRMAVLPTAQLQVSTIDQLLQTKLRALPLLHADFLEHELQPVSTADVPAGCWDLESLDPDLGPWLLYPPPDSALRARPMLYVAGSPAMAAAPPEGACPLATAMAGSDAERRASAIADVVDAMARDLDHPSWRLVEKQHVALAHLPLGTLDYWRAFARQPAASVAVLLKLSHDMPRLAARMREELGVVWDLVGLAVLEAAIDRLRSSWARQLERDEPDPLVGTLTERLLTQVGIAEPAMSIPVDIALFRKNLVRPDRVMPLQAEISAGPMKLAQRLWTGVDSHVQRFLLRAHLDDQYWPRFDLCEQLIAKLQQRFPAASSELLTKCGRHLWWMPMQGQTGIGRQNVKLDVANVPMLAGLLSQLSPDEKAWWTPEEMGQIRQLRAFDPAWFETACRLGGLIALSLRPPSPAVRAHLDRASGPGRTWVVSRH